MSNLNASQPNIPHPVDADTRSDQHAANHGRLQQQWAEPLTAREWDARFPGILDGLAVLGGAANVILQLSSLPVGHGVAESKVDSGAIFKHPVKRARTTFTYLAVAMMGTTAEKVAYRKAVNQSHAQVRSEANAKVKYNAFDPELQLWVAACLYWGFFDANAKLRGEMSPAMKEEFYRLAEPLGTTLQVRADMWPADAAAFDRYWQNGLQKLVIDDKVRFFLTKLVNLRFLHPAISTVAAPFNRFVTIGFLPQPVRDQMQFEWSPQQQKAFERVMRALGTVNGLLPRAVRQFPFNAVMWDFRRRMRKGLPLV